MLKRVFLVVGLLAGLCASPGVYAYEPPGDHVEKEPLKEPQLYVLHINFWANEAKVGETDVVGANIIAAPCQTNDIRFAAATHCSVCVASSQKKVAGINDCGHSSAHGGKWLTHYDIDVRLCDTVAATGSTGSADRHALPSQFHQSDAGTAHEFFDDPGEWYAGIGNRSGGLHYGWLYDYDKCHRHGPPPKPPCEAEQHEECPKPDPVIPTPDPDPLPCRVEDGYRGAADDVFYVNIADRLIAEHGVPANIGQEGEHVPGEVAVTDLTVEARWKTDNMRRNDDVPGERPLLRIPRLSAQGHQLSIDNDASGGPEVVYRPKRWAAGFDSFVYTYPNLECSATATIVFTDSRPVSVPAFNTPESTTTSVYRYAWEEAKGATHKHAHTEQRIKHVTRRVRLYTHRCVFASDFFTRPGGVFDHDAYQSECFETVHYQEPETVTVVEEVEDLYKWVHATDGPRRVVDVQHVSGRFKLYSLTGGRWRYLDDGGAVRAAYDYDFDTWHGGYLYHDPETGELPPVEGNHDALSGFLITRDVAGPADGDITWRYVNHTDAGDISTGNILYKVVTFEGVQPVSAALPKHTPPLVHLRWHDNLRPPGTRALVADPEYVEGWYYRRDRHHPLRWHDLCVDLAGSADTKTQVCLIARNSTANQLISDELTDDGAQVTVRYWVCDRRVEAYWADRSAANAAGFNAYDYCSSNFHTIGFVPQPAPRYPN